MSRWVVCDVDGTLLPGSSLERQFIWRMGRAQLLKAEQWVAFALQAVRALGAGRLSLALAGNKAMYLGLRPERLTPEANRLIEQLVVERISVTGRQRLQHFRDQGFGILLMTGAPDFLATPLARLLGADALICARLEIRAGRYTGRVLGLHPYGRRKKQLLLEKQAALGLDFSASVVFANHRADIHHMELFACPTAVNPTPALKRLALRRGWPIEYWPAPAQVSVTGQLPPGGKQHPVPSNN